MELLIGFVIGLLVQSMVRFGWRMLNPPRPALPQPPRTAAQLANEAAYEAVQAHTPRVVSIRLQRRTQRGRRRRIMERESRDFED